MKPQDKLTQAEIDKRVNMHDELISHLTQISKMMERENQTGALLDSIQQLLKQAEQK